MRRASKLFLVAVTTLLIALGVPATASASGGVTVTPATLTLNLVPDSQEQKTEFSLTNNYDAPVLLRFAFEPRLQATNAQNPIKQLSISQPGLVIQPGETVKQTITVRDDDRLSPGSQLADLVISQISTPGAHVGVQPSIRMPIVVVKQAGAVAGLSLAGVSVPRLSLSMPKSLGVTLHNKGNVIVIPRGVITISGPSGEVKRGVLNTSSQAVTPGGDIALTTSLTKLEGTQLPGFYRATISYGLGGGQKPISATSTFFYIAWWHVATIILLGLAARFLIRHSRNVHRKKASASHHPPGRPLLLKKGAA